MKEEILDNPVTGESMRILESTAQSFRAQYTLKPHGEIPGEHFHPRKEQLISVLSGEMHLRIEGEHRILRAGETATLPVGARHFQWNPCETEAVVIEEVRPAGRIHDFFKVLFGLARDGRTDANGFPSLFLGAAVFAEFEDSIQLAPLGSRLVCKVLGPVALAMGGRRRIEKYLHQAPAADGEEQERHAVPVDDAARLTSIFGRWPSFHDAEVLRVGLDRSGPAGPTLEIVVHVAEPSGEVDARGVWVLQHHTEVTLRFERIDDLKLEEFNHQNVIRDLEIATIAGGERALRVTMHSSYGLAATFDCARARVVDARPFTPAA